MLKIKSVYINTEKGIGKMTITLRILMIKKTLNVIEGSLEFAFNLLKMNA